MTDADVKFLSELKIWMNSESVLPPALRSIVAEPRYLFDFTYSIRLGKAFIGDGQRRDAPYCSVRLWNILKQIGFAQDGRVDLNYFVDLTSRKHFLRHRLCGRKTLREMENILLFFGLDFAPDN